MYVNMCLCLYNCICIYLCMYECTIQIYMHASMQLCYVCIYVRISVCLFMYISKFLCMYICGNKLIKAPLE